MKILIIDELKRESDQYLIKKNRVLLKIAFWEKRNWVIATISYFLIPISLDFGWKDKGIRKLELVAKNQFLYDKFGLLLELQYKGRYIRLKIIIIINFI